MKRKSVIVVAVMPLFLCLLDLPASAQQKALNIAGIHQLVSSSKSEHSRQTQARNLQGENTVREEVNRTLLENLQRTYSSLQSRFSFLSSAINAAEIMTGAVPLLDGILTDQKSLIALARQNALIIPLLVQTETELVLHSKDLVYYVIGLCSSVGVINNLKPSDRKLLFDYVITELRRLKAISSGLVNSISRGVLLRALKGSSPFADFISADKSLVDQIITNAKYLRR